MALRGLRPIAEIQYLDYLLYCFFVLSDDLIRYELRVNNFTYWLFELEGTGWKSWHSGSPMGVILAGKRNAFMRAKKFDWLAGFYNLLLKGDDPAIVIRTTYAYRLKEHLPENIGEFTTPLGIPEIAKKDRYHGRFIWFNIQYH